jgi:hypothetical protein
MLSQCFYLLELEAGSAPRQLLTCIVSRHRFRKPSAATAILHSGMVER